MVTTIKYKVTIVRKWLKKYNLLKRIHLSTIIYVRKEWNVTYSVSYFKIHGGGWQV